MPTSDYDHEINRSLVDGARIQAQLPEFADLERVTATLEETHGLNYVTTPAATVTALLQALAVQAPHLFKQAAPAPSTDLAAPSDRLVKFPDINQNLSDDFRAYLGAQEYAKLSPENRILVANKFKASQVAKSEETPLVKFQRNLMAKYKGARYLELMTTQEKAQMELLSDTRRPQVDAATPIAFRGNVQDMAQEIAQLKASNPNVAANVLQARLNKITQLESRIASLASVPARRIA
jgi:hypothetical protein